MRTLWAFAQGAAAQGLNLMERQFVELAGLPAGILARLEKCGHSSERPGGEVASLETVATLLGAFTAILSAEELLMNADLPALAKEARVLIEITRVKARDAIEAAVEAPGDASDRLALLAYAVDLEGTDSPLVARIGLTLAAANSLPAVALAG